MVACNSSNSIMNQLASVDSPGRYIEKLSTDKSAYLPGEMLQLSMLLNLEEDNQDYSIEVRLTQLSELITDFSFELSMIIDTFTYSLEIELPNQDYQGYALEVYLYNHNTLLDFAMTGVDVSSSWNVFPRYAALSHYDLEDASEVEEVLSNFKDYHINGLMYYDVIDRHDRPLAGEVLSPDDSWNTINQSLATKSILESFIEIGHQYQMSSFVYNLLFGGYEDYEIQGVNKEWGMYTDNFHSFQDFHPLPSSWETGRLYLFNPGNEYWQNYYLSVMSDLLKVYDFDGIQVDSLGSRGIRYDYDGNLLYLDQLYTDLLSRLHEELSTQIIFNPVNGYGLDEILDEDFNDIIYEEIWSGNYYSLHKTLFDIYESTNGNGGTVLAAYMNYGNDYGYFNEASVLYTNVVIMASGGSHLEMVDTGMLSKEYYPGTMLRMTEELKKKMLIHYSFLVAYENYLRGPGLVSSENETLIENYQLSSIGEKGKIWSFSRTKDDNVEILHLINMMNVNATDWVDSQRTKESPEIQYNLKVRHYCSFQPNQISIASPDQFEGISFTVPFTSGTDSLGYYVEFELPSFEYYSMIIFL